MNAICLAIDRLHIGYLGAYGNAWIETPAFDRLACESFLFDQALIGSPNTADFCRESWLGRHPLLPSDLASPGPSLPRRLAQAGVAAALLTDDPTVADDPLAADFAQILNLDEPRQIQTADDVASTHLAGCFAQIIHWLESADSPFFVWVHLSSLGAVWDAPYALREQYAEPGDPDPPRSPEPPRLILPPNHDPDTLLGMTQSYAAQVSVLDICLGALLEAVSEMHLDRDTLLALVSSRGYPLGEHARVGDAGDDALHAELVHVPMTLRFPGGLGAAERSQALVSPTDLGPTLLDWWSLDAADWPAAGRSLAPIVRGQTESIRDRLLLGKNQSESKPESKLESEKALRVPAWHLRLTDQPRLYAKPDDRWEVNDVADRCPGVVDEMQNAARDFEEALRRDRLDQLAPLGPALLNGLD